jgi:type IX secretion system PorP/SprF family membrane protein
MLLSNKKNNKFVVSKKMMKGIKILLPLVILVQAISFKAEAQDLHFSQFYANPLFLNPAFAGSVRCPRIVTTYRNQWPGVIGNYVTYAATFDRHVDDLGGGIGVIAYSDRMGNGTINTNSVSGIYSYQINVNRSFSIRAAIQATFVQRTIDPSRMNFPDQIHSRYGFIYNTSERFSRNNRSFADFSAGIMGFGNNFFGGIAVHHLAEPDEAFIKTGSANNSRLYRKYTGHIGAIIPVGEDDDINLSPNVIYQMQGTFQQLNLGMYFTKGPFVGGLWYRNRDALITLVGFRYNIFKIGYSYDVTISKLRGGYGSHELTASFQFYCRKKRKVFNTVNCPTF